MKSCQEALTSRGYPCAVDGIFGSDTEANVKKFQLDAHLAADGIVGPKTWDALLAAPAPTPDPPCSELDWSAFVPLLSPAMAATYTMPGQMPEFPSGISLPTSYRGTERTNCTLFTAYLLGCGFGATFREDEWTRWQISAGQNYAYDGYGPGVCADWGVAEMRPCSTIPRNGVYLLQTLQGWPSGHSWIILDYDDASGKILTLESNTPGTGLNGVGFLDLGPIRSTNAHDWKNRVTTTWEKRISKATEISMARLNIDHDSVRSWIESQ